MPKRYIITLMAANRVGILASLTTALDELGGDMQEVSQTVMQKFFTIIMAADFPDHRDPQVIVDHIRDAGRTFHVDVTLKDPAQETLQEDSAAEMEKYFLIVTGQNKPGAIRQIAYRLAQAQIDITDLHAKSIEGDAFSSVMELAVPPGVDALKLQKDLEDLGNGLNLTAALQHENIFAATNDPLPVRIRLMARKPDEPAAGG